MWGKEKKNKWGKNKVKKQKSKETIEHTNNNLRGFDLKVNPPLPDLLYRQECFTGKFTTRKIHVKLHPGPEWRIFHILTGEDIDDVISRSFTAVRCKQLYHR